MRPSRSLGHGRCRTASRLTSSALSAISDSKEAVSHMAAPIVVSVPTNATADQVFAAITESSGLAALWIQDSPARRVIGSVTRMNLPSGSLLQLRVDELEVGHRVVWTPISEFSR